MTTSKSEMTDRKLTASIGQGTGERKGMGRVFD